MISIHQLSLVKEGSDLPRYPSFPRLIKLASNGNALNRLEFSIFTYNGLGTSSGMTSPSALDTELAVVV
jgi:hypothetical protein